MVVSFQTKLSTSRIKPHAPGSLTSATEPSLATPLPPGSCSYPIRKFALKLRSILNKSRNEGFE
jgi:hypothetical protein